MQGYIDGTVIEAKGLMWVNSFVLRSSKTRYKKAILDINHKG